MLQRGGRCSAIWNWLTCRLHLAASAVADLENDPDVEYVSPDRPVAATLDYANPAINANIAASTAGMAPRDRGGHRQRHHGQPPDVQTSAASAAWSTPDFLTSEGADTWDATATAPTWPGSWAAMRRNRRDRLHALLLGYRTQRQFVNLRVLDRYGAGTDSAVIAAIQRAIA